MRQHDPINGWEDYESLRDDLFGEMRQGKKLVFRGHGCCGWTLKPKLLRMLPDDITRERACKVEQNALETFRSGRADSPYCNTFSWEHWLLWWTVMQHYGAPTRLLDWTANPDYALFFAVEEDGREERDAIDGALLFLDAELVNEARRPWSMQSEGLWELRHQQLTDGESGHKLLYFTQSIPEERLGGQKGSFTMCPDITQDHQCVLKSMMRGNGKSLSDVLRKVKIKGPAKLGLHRKLLDQGITHEALFHRLECLGKRVKDQVTAEARTGT